MLKHGSHHPSGDSSNCLGEMGIAFGTQGLVSRNAKPPVYFTERISTRSAVCAHGNGKSQQQ